MKPLGLFILSLFFVFSYFVVAYKIVSSSLKNAAQTAVLQLSLNVWEIELFPVAP
jgi:hypothetical protein